MKVGRKKSVPLREIWPRESNDFTPWLADNLELLGEDLELDLELLEREHPVGSFSLDILAREVNSDKIVAIENQLEGTDHTHLGQLITYAAGVGKSGIGIWICKEISEEHKKALEWLNDNSDWDFLAIELRAFSIGGSDPAPFFDVVVKPNLWSRAQRIKEKAAISPTNEAYRKFWSGLLEKFKERYPGITHASGDYPQSWCAIPAGKSGIYYSWAFRLEKRFHVELYIDFGDKLRNEDFFEEVLNRKSQIETAFGDALSWEKMEAKRACRVAYYRGNVSVKAIPEDLEEWAIEKMKRLRDVLFPIHNELLA